MKKLLIALPVALSLLLASCSESNIEKAQQVVAAVKKHCGIAVSIASVAAAFAVPNPAITSITAMAAAICEQANDTDTTDKRKTGASAPVIEYSPGFSPLYIPVEDDGTMPPPPPTPAPEPEPEPAPLPVPLPEPAPGDDCVAVINGVCITKEEGGS